jgi:hypothetical protein
MTCLSLPAGAGPAQARPDDAERMVVSPATIAASHPTEAARLGHQTAYPRPATLAAGT